MAVLPIKILQKQFFEGFDMAKKRVLGRGLSEILGEVRESYENNMGGGDADFVVEIEMEKIIPNPYQPRKHFSEESIQELASSIELHGLLQPVLVYQDAEKYVLIAGERRFRACKQLKKETIKAIITEIDLNQLRELALIENIQREDLNPIDLACAYEELLVEHQLTHQELAQRIQKSRAQITNTLRLLKLIPVAQQFLLEEKITQGHAKVLVALDREDQEKMVHSIVGQRLSVRETERLIGRIKRNQKQEASDLELPLAFKLDASSKERIAKVFKQNQINFKILNEERLVIELNNQRQVEQFLSLIER